MNVHLPTKRGMALAAALPIAFFGHNVFPVAAATPTCHGHSATQVVSSHSPHVVHGTSHRDVIVVKDPGHVVKAGGGNDLVCGSSGHDDLRGGSGNDHLYGGAGSDS